MTALGGALAGPASGSPAIFSFGYTGGMQTWVVPAGVTAVRVNLYGAGGGEPHSDGFHPGLGGRAETDHYAVTPGSTLHVVVGGKGARPDNNSTGAGYNGGGAGRQFGGGGATDIRIGGTALVNRVLVAGGAGGTGSFGGQNGGDGGGLTGGGAGGGTQTAGGVGTYPSWSGSFGQGGPGPNSGPNVVGGGGGGWYGGAGGPGGGGGGSGHGTDRTNFWPGVERGNGHATIAIGPPTGTYSGRTEHTTAISFHLSYDYSTVTNFRWADRVRFESATFSQAATRGSFSHWGASDMHFWGAWEGSAVTGGISYLNRGVRHVVRWTANRY